LEGKKRIKDRSLIARESLIASVVGRDNRKSILERERIKKMQNLPCRRENELYQGMRYTQGMRGDKE